MEIQSANLWKMFKRIVSYSSKHCDFIESRPSVGEFLFQYLFPNTSYLVDLESVVPCRRGSASLFFLGSSLYANSTEILERQKKAYLKADLLKVNEEINALEGDEARKAYILSRKQKVQDIVSVIHQSRLDETILTSFHIPAFDCMRILGKIADPWSGLGAASTPGREEGRVS